MWNDTDTPIGYLITFRSYGTWLHGDDVARLIASIAGTNLPTLQRIQTGLTTIRLN